MERSYDGRNGSYNNIVNVGGGIDCIYKLDGCHVTTGACRYIYFKFATSILVVILAWSSD